MKRSALTAPQAGALNQAAATLEINPDWLFAVVNHESGWNPSIKATTSSARGLLQFIDATAQDLGYSDSADLVAKNPTVEAQLVGPVVDYLSAYKPISSLADLAAVVFYPAARKNPGAPLPAAVQKANPGIITLQDYVDKYLHVTTAEAVTGAGLVVVALAGAFLWWASKH